MFVSKTFCQFAIAFPTKFFDSRAEEKEYHATEKIVKAYSADEAIAAMDAEIEKFSGDGAFGDYTAEQKNNILNEINNYDSRKTQVENNAQMTDEQKKNAMKRYEYLQKLSRINLKKFDYRIIDSKAIIEFIIIGFLYEELIKFLIYNEDTTHGRIQ